MALVKRIPVLCEADAAEFLGLAVKTLQNMRSRKTGPKGPEYSKLPNGRVRYRLDALERWRDGNTRISTSEPSESVPASP